MVTEPGCASTAQPSGSKPLLRTKRMAPPEFLTLSWRRLLLLKSDERYDAARLAPWSCGGTRIESEGERTKSPRCSATCCGIGSSFGRSAARSAVAAVVMLSDMTAARTASRINRPLGCSLWTVSEGDLCANPERSPIVVISARDRRIADIVVELVIEQVLSVDGQV